MFESNYLYEVKYDIIKSIKIPLRRRTAYMYKSEYKYKPCLKELFLKIYKQIKSYIKELPINYSFKFVKAQACFTMVTILKEYDSILRLVINLKHYKTPKGYIVSLAIN